jgi:hypothetical protein
MENNLNVTEAMHNMMTDALANKYERIGPNEWEYIGDDPVKVEIVNARPVKVKNL